MLSNLASSYATFKKTNTQQPSDEEINFAKILVSPYYYITRYGNATPELEITIKSISTLMKTLKLPEPITDPTISCKNKSLTLHVLYKDPQQKPKFNYCMLFCRYNHMSKVERKKEDINDFLIDIFNASFPDTKVSNITINHRGEPRTASCPYDPS
jgi:hypothetical protein